MRLDEGVSCSFVALKLSIEKFFGLERLLGLVGRGRGERMIERENMVQ
jgi:hypothetical protein